VGGEASGSSPELSGGAATRRVSLELAVHAHIHQPHHHHHPLTIMAANAEARYIPGAPPPSAASKSQKKKRKGGQKDDGPGPEDILDLPTARAAAHIDTAPSKAAAANGVAAGTVEPSLVVSNEERDEIAASAKRTGPYVEAVNKKIRTLGKKIVR